MDQSDDVIHISSRIVERAAPRVDPPVTVRFAVFGKMLPASAFLVITALDVNALRLDAAFLTHRFVAAVLLSGLAAVTGSVFAAIPVVFLLRHGAPLSKDARPWIRVLPIVATFALPAIVALAPAGPHAATIPLPVEGLACAMVVAGTSFGTWGLLTLRSSFSLSPEARSLADTGPYRLLRHPIYAAEIVTAFGAALASLDALLLGGAVLLLGFQVVRIGAEERLLTSALPGYRCLKRSSPHRLIPGVW